MPLLTSDTYTGVAGRIADKYWFDRVQTGLTIKNNDTVNKITVYVADDEKTLAPQETFVFDEEFEYFHVKTKRGTASFTATVSGSLTTQKADNVQLKNTVDGIPSQIITLTSGKADKTDIISVQSQVTNLVSNVGNESGNSEIVDIRVGFDGTAYSSAGEAMRKQVDSINKGMFAPLITTFSDLELGGIGNDGANLVIANYVRTKNYITVTEHKTVVLVIASGYSAKVLYYNSSHIFVNNTAYYTTDTNVGVSSPYFRVAVRKGDGTTPITLEEAQANVYLKVVTKASYALGDKLKKNSLLCEHGSINSSGADVVVYGHLRSSPGYPIDLSISGVKIFIPSDLEVAFVYYNTLGVFQEYFVAWHKGTVVLPKVAKKARILVRKADGSNDVNILDYMRILVTPASKTEIIPYTWIQKTMDGSGAYVDSTLGIAIDGKLSVVPGVRYRFTCNPGYTIVLNYTIDGVSGNYKWNTRQMEAIFQSKLVGVVVNKSDLSAITTSENVGLVIEKVIERNSTADYDIVVAASNSSMDDKAKADLVCDGVDDEVEIQCAMNCNVTVGVNAKVLILPGDYNINNFYKVKDGTNNGVGYCACCLQKSIFGGLNTVTIEGRYSEYIASNSSTKIVVTESCSAALTTIDEYAIFGAYRSTGEFLGNINNMFVIYMKNLFISPRNIDKPVIVIDGAGCGGMGLQNINITRYVDGFSALITYDEILTLPIGLIGVRGVMGSNHGVNNYIKNCRIIGMHEPLALTGEHFIIEDTVLHSGYYGFTIGNYNVRPQMQHPNVFIGCSIEQCYCMGLLNRYGATVESEVDTPEQTLIWIGGSTETTKDGHNMLGIKEIVKGAYGGRFETDFGNYRIFANDGSGKNMDVTNLTYPKRGLITLRPSANTCHDGTTFTDTTNLLKYEVINGTWVQI